jgi:hypothetical protein
VPTAVLWVLLDAVRPQRPKRSGKTRGPGSRLGFYGAMTALLLWVTAVHTAADSFVRLLLLRNPQAQDYVMAALSANGNAKLMMASAVLVAGPTIVLWMAASWGRSWLRPAAALDAPRDTLPAAAKEQE